MWRRIAGGMTEERHGEIWNYLKPHLERRFLQSQPKHQPKLKGVQPEGLDEMVRLAAALEHLDAKTRSCSATGSPLACPPPAHGRGHSAAWARVPLYGSIHKTVDPEKASEWLNLLLDAHSRNIEGALFAIVQLARLSGDRSRDFDDSLRTRAVDALRRSQAPDSWQRLVLEVVTMETADQARAFGDTLPAGLAA